MTAAFAERVARARRYLDEAQAPDEVGYTDQLAAASAEAYATLDQLAAPWAALLGEPLRRTDSTDLGHAAALFVVLCESRACPHLRRGGPQPAWHVLETRRIVCRRCMATYVRPVVPADCCDLCREPADRFTEFAVQVGPVLHLGHAGGCCAWAMNGAPT